VESLESKSTKEKTKRDVKLLEEFLRKEKNDDKCTLHSSRIKQVSCGVCSLC